MRGLHLQVGMSGLPELPQSFLSDSFSSLEQRDANKALKRDAIA